MHPRLVLFDGVCVLCDSSMRWLLNADRKGILRFAPLQGETAKQVLARHPELEGSPPTVIYIRDFGEPSERTYQRSDAAAAILEDLGGLYRTLALYRVLPRWMRDSVYDWVATHRYRWFGKLDACQLPEIGTENRFLP